VSREIFVRSREIFVRGTPPPSLPRRYAPGEEPEPVSLPKLSPLIRSLHAGALLAITLALLLHLGDLRWTRFLVAFALIDLGGYLPGAVAFHRARGARIAPVYHHLYNVTHSFLTAAAAITIWGALAGPEWAMLAIPLHLCGDRALFGNGPKPAHLPFDRRAEGSS
jgi:hypothetical protein